MTKELSIQMAQEQHGRILCGPFPGALPGLLASEKEVFLIYDNNVSEAAGALLEQLPGVKGSIAIDATEENKTLETVQQICRQLLEADASRHAFLVALGGGITTDITGFVAAIYKRGIRYGNVPTTLLSQVDAAIGGKTGVNLDGYKNMLGAFLLPEFTCLCTEVLNTLPEAVFKEGLSEMLKTFLLADGAAYQSACRFFAVAQNDNGGTPMGKNALICPPQATIPPSHGQKCPNLPTGIGPLIYRAAQIKAQIVQRDPFEGGERAKLNLGHTFAHAIEHEAQQRGEHISHGEAVAIGILLAARLSEKLNVAEKGLAARLRADFETIGLKTQSPYPVQSLLQAMTKDKKAAGGRIKFVLPVKLGEVILKDISIHDLHFDTE